MAHRCSAGDCAHVKLPRLHVPSAGHESFRKLSVCFTTDLLSSFANHKAVHGCGYRSRMFKDVFRQLLRFLSVAGLVPSGGRDQQAFVRVFPALVVLGVV